MEKPVPVPTPEELSEAVAHAELLRTHGEDTHYVAKSLINLHHRIGFLQEVLDKADLYLHSGEGAHEHAELVKAIERARQSAVAPGEEDDGIHPW